MSEKKRKPPILKAEHLTKMFPVKKRKLIENRDTYTPQRMSGFEVYPGEVLGIVGESGSGKSTLARTILALTPSTSGQVFLSGRGHYGLQGTCQRKASPAQRNTDDLSDPYASLNPKIQDRQCDRRANAASRSGIQLCGGKGKDPAPAGSRGAAACGVRPISHEFSGGQRHIGIVRALAVNPKLIFAMSLFPHWMFPYRRRF